jgi:NADPH:quinone reductase-like Zn-dependent oxidoreductase
VAVSVNPVDTKVRGSRHQGSAPTQPTETPRILGWDAAGVVVALGNRVTGFNVGDEVFYAGALERPGTNAEFHTVDLEIVGRKRLNQLQFVLARPAEASSRDSEAHVAGHGFAPALELAGLKCLFTGREIVHADTAGKPLARLLQIAHYVRDAREIRRQSDF